MSQMPDTDFDLDIDRHALAAREAKCRADDWLRRHPEDDPADVTARYLAEARRELELP